MSQSLAFALPPSLLKTGELPLLVNGNKTKYPACLYAPCHHSHTSASNHDKAWLQLARKVDHTISAVLTTGGKYVRSAVHLKQVNRIISDMCS